MACISKRRDRWVLDFYDQHGERQRLSLPEGTTKGQAKEALREIEDAVIKGIYLPSKKTPLFSEVAQDWLEYKRSRLRETTWEVYEGHARNHFQDLNTLKINRITIATVEEFITDDKRRG
jgi:integrase